MGMISEKESQNLDISDFIKDLYICASRLNRNYKDKDKKTKAHRQRTDESEKTG